MPLPFLLDPMTPPKKSGVRPQVTLTRRQWLIGGGAGIGLVVAWGVWPRRYRPNVVAAPGETVMNAFLKIGEDGHVTAIVPQAEMGQGVWTSFAQILADELGADWRTIAVEPAPIGPLYANSFLMEQAAEAMVPGFLAGAARWAAHETAVRSSFMMTAGSTSIRAFEQPLRAAAATARALLQMAAAADWGVDWRALDTAAGFVTHGEEKLRFAALAAKAAGYTPPDAPPLREIGEGQISGRSVPRLDVPAKIDGSALYTGDVRLPDMVFASVRHGPYGDASFKSIDRPAAEKVPGVLKVIENPQWVAAIANTWWAADRALDLARPRFTLAATPPDDTSIAKAIEAAMKDGSGKRYADLGDADRLLAAPAGRIEAAYAVPFAAHAPIEPLTATARVVGDRLEVWAPTQAPGVARAAAARAAGYDEAQVTIYPMLVGGGFGRKVEVDAVAQVALLATLVKRPVQLTWPRAEETMRSRFRPPARAAMAATIGQGGQIAAWRARIVAPSAMSALQHRLMPGFAIGGQGGPERAAVDGATPPYDLAAVAVEHVPVDVGIDTGMWRSVAHSYTAFFTEGFMDELAQRAAIDPIAYRMQHLGHAPRLARCLQTVQAMAKWNGAGNGQGVAIHSAFGSHVATMAEVSVRDGRIKVAKIWAAIDCGRVIHPDIVAQQIESGIIWGLAAAFGPAPGFAAGVATIRDFAGLGLPRLVDTPEIEVQVIASEEAPGGVGELGVPTVAPAIANALFAANGQRLRTLPLKVSA